MTGTTGYVAEPLPGDLSGQQPGPPTSRRRSLLTKIGLTIVCLALAAMWIYYFFFASTKAAYRIDDAAWRARATEVCTKYETQRLALVDTAGGYIAKPTPEQITQRADVVTKATDILEAELNELVAVQPASDRDRELLAKYEGYYRTMLRDRRDYIAQLRRFEVQPYTETLEGSGPVSNLLIDFTTVNQINKCTPPGELGGDAK